MPTKALIIDDERDLCELIEMSLIGQNIVCDSAHTFKQASAKLKQNHTEYQFVICDIKLPDGDGLDLLEMCQKKYPELPICMITAHGNMDLAVRALRLGAFDFINKPFDLQQLRNLCKAAEREAKKNQTDNKQEQNIAASSASSGGQKQLIGSSSVMDNINEMIAKVAKSCAPVFIHGESGTGKEVVARLIHQQSNRGNGPFIAVNCGAIPENLVESEFFGYKKGAFTGANQDQDGLFMAANGGTLFLDEVADLPLSMQVKLLRAIQERAIRPVGGKQEEAVDIRIVSATHKNLALNVREGEFREDLFYRLNVIHVEIPPLRERKSDIEDLVVYLNEQICKRHGMPLRPFAEEAVEKLKTYDYPGNIRELENIIERAITFADGEVIQVDDIHFGAGSMVLKGTAESAQEDDTEQEALPNDLEQYMNEVEKAVLLRALQETDNNKTLAAKRLGISFRAIRYKLQKLGID